MSNDGKIVDIPPWGDTSHETDEQMQQEIDLADREPDAGEADPDEPVNYGGDGGAGSLYPDNSEWDREAEPPVGRRRHRRFVIAPLVIVSTTVLLLGAFVFLYNNTREPTTPDSTPDVITPDIISNARLGISVTANSDDDSDEGVLIIVVFEGAPGHLAKLQPGDIILGIDDKRLFSLQDFSVAVAPAGKKMRLIVRKADSGKVIAINLEFSDDEISDGETA